MEVAWGGEGVFSLFEARTLVRARYWSRQNTMVCFIFGRYHNCYTSTENETDCYSFTRTASVTVGLSASKICLSQWTQYETASSNVCQLLDLGVLTVTLPLAAGNCQLH